MLKDLLYVGHTEKKKTLKNKPKTIQKMAIGTFILIIILNVNELNAPTKKYRLNGRKTRPIYMLPKETHFRSRDTYRLKVRG